VTLRLAAALLLLIFARPAAGQGGLPTRTLLLAGVAYELELAADPASRERGLMGRAEIPARGGMLFAFPDDAPRAFWMKDCLVDIDVAFLDRSGVVVATHRMRAEPPRRPGEGEAAYEARLRHYASGLPARFAVELRAGSLQRLGLGPGDAVDVRGVPLPLR
jgi:uncharacterized membrane protein (UPF0127 family)